MAGGGGTISTSEPRLGALQVQQSSYGLAVPIVYGRTRVSGNLIWYGDFTAVARTETQTSGGKGGGGVSQSSTSYTYEAAVLMALAEGPLGGIVSAWRGKERFEAGPLAAMGLTLASGAIGQPTWAHLGSRHPDQAVGYSGTAYVCSAAYTLADNAEVPNHTFEVDARLQFGGGISDADPRDVVLDLLTNPQYGAGFPVAQVADLGAYSSYCRALGLFISPALTQQQEARQHLADIMAQTNSEFVWSEGRLKVLPYGDAPASGNGAAFVPSTTPVFDLTDDDFLGGEDGGDPVKCARSTPADASNQVQVEYLNRTNAYNIEIVEAKDQASIERYGLRPADPVQMHGICRTDTARLVAQMLLQRALAVRNRYEFRLGWRFGALEPMDIVTLTDDALGLYRTPVRITEVEEDEGGLLTVKAEDCPIGMASAPVYPTTPGKGYAADFNAGPGNATAPVIMEAPLALGADDPQLWIAAAGGAQWGGAQVWASTDGASYRRIGEIKAPARLGVTASALAPGPALDQAQTLDVDISASGGQLLAGTQDDAVNLSTACFVGGEFLAYAGATLTGPGTYRLGYLVRGAWGSEITAHAAGEPFARIDDTLLRYSYPPEWVGRTIWIKLASHNVYGSGQQPLDEVSATSYVIKGAPLRAVTGLKLASPWSAGVNLPVLWDRLPGAASYDIEVQAGVGVVRQVTGLIDNSWVYTTQDMRADGGPWRSATLRARARAVTGRTSPWATLSAINPQTATLQGLAILPGPLSGTLSFAAPTDADWAGVLVWLSTDPAVPQTAATLIYDGPPITTLHMTALADKTPLQGGVTYCVRAAGFDALGRDGLAVSSSVAFTAQYTVAQQLDAALAAGIDSSATAKVQAESQARSSALAAEAQQRANQIAQSSATASSALAAARTALEQSDATEKTERLSGDAANGAAITTLTQAQASDRSASATRFDQLQSSIGSGSLVPDRALADPTQWRSHYGGNLTPFFVAAPDGPIYKTAVQSIAGGGAFWNYSRTKVRIEPGRTYRFSMRVKRTGGTNPGYFTWWKSTANAYGSVGLPALANFPDGVWTLVERDIPAATFGDVLVEPGFALNHSTVLGDGSIWQMQDFRFWDVTDTLGVSDAKASITTLQTTVANNKLAATAETSQLSAALSSADARLSAADTSEREARTSADSALTQRVDTLTATVSGNNGTLTAAQQAEQQARVSGDAAEAGARSTLAAELRGADSTLQANINSANSASVTRDQANTSAITAAVSRIGTTESGITALQQTQASDRSSTATQFSQVGTRLDGQSATITQHTQSINGLSAQWGFRLDANGRVAGITSVANGDRSEILLYGGVVKIASDAGAKPLLASYTARTQVQPGVWVEPGTYISGLTVDYLRAGQIDTSGLVVRGTDGRPVFASGDVPAGVVAGLGSLATAKQYRVGSCGNNSTVPGTYAGLFDSSGVSQGVSARSYSMARIRRSDGAVVFAQTYDVHGNGEISQGRGASTLAGDLNGSVNDVIVVVWTTDEPRANRTNAGLPEAIYRCGGSRAVFAAPTFAYRGAYILIGIGGCGEGNGFEAYAGSADSSPDAFCEATFSVSAGQLLVGGNSYTPKGYDWAALFGPGKPQDNATVGAQIGVNLSGQFDSGNISTFMSGAFIRYLMSDYAQFGSLSAIIANLGTVTAGTILSGRTMGGAYSGYGWPGGTAGGYYLGPEGLLLGNPNNGKYLQVTADGNIYTPKFRVENGVMTIDQANVIKTLNIADNSVTIPAVSTGGGNISVNNSYTQSLSVNTPGGRYVLFLKIDAVSNTVYSESPNGGGVNAYHAVIGVSVKANGATVYSKGNTGSVLVNEFLILSAPEGALNIVVIITNSPGPYYPNPTATIDSRLLFLATLK